MITCTLIIEKSTKGTKLKEYKKEIRIFHSVDKARKTLTPIIAEMRKAKEENRRPKKQVYAVSYDSDYERELLLSMHAIESIDNEEGGVL